MLWIFALRKGAPNAPRDRKGQQPARFAQISA